MFHSYAKHKQISSFQTTILFHYNNLDLVHGVEHYTPSRPPARLTELTSRWKIHNRKRSLWLETQSSHFLTKTDSNGPNGHTLAFTMSDLFLQLEARSKSRKTTFLQNRAMCHGFANPPWCLTHHCLTKMKEQATQTYHSDNTTVESSTMILNNNVTPEGSD